ncbi:DUF4892 domain-containing protein [Nitrincola tapanii]|uniref:DUF4892 domain-containing protein n=1 Tax=Nitrincola tapanii TaxID=1708751 RepID=A0A5A9W513_9GAMM|nr:DUF4892 domain-containing protein [Nitrincola tapanii]KAA0875837.1 DUF4892 domain-containing protein [Nitrincola tapanii]
MHLHKKLMILVGLCGLFWSHGALSATTLPPWLHPFPLSTLENQTRQPTPDYLLALSQITRIQGLLRTQNERRLSGQLLRSTWELASGHGPEQGFEHFKQQLQQASAEILFECASRQCGASNLWANQVFGYANLLGVDSSQFYLAAKLGSDYFALYAVRRGNGRVYLHLDYLQTLSPEVEVQVSELSWQERLEQRGYVSLRAASLENELEPLLQDWLQSSTANYRLVLHRAAQGSDPELLLAEEAALALQARLQDAGFTQIEVYSVAALVPEVLAGQAWALTLIRLP